MLRVILKQIPVLFLTFIGVLIVTFSLIHLVPGDPVLLMLGQRSVSPEAYAEMQASLGLDKPLFTQFLLYFQNALHGDLGVSILSKESVVKEFFARFPATLELGLAGVLFATLIGIPAGIIAAVKRNSVYDYSIMGGSLIGYSMPIFWWGLVLILLFSVKLGWTPVSGRMSAMYDIQSITGFLLIDSLISPDGGWAAFWDALRHLILPAVALGTIPLAVIARMTRSSLLEVMGEDYIRTAKAKGLSRFSVIGVHAFRNALIPVITVLGLMVGTIVTGAILTETIFSWPGIGKWLVHSVTSRDYPVIQGGVLLISISIVLVNLLVDISYAVVNPRMRER